MLQEEEFVWVVFVQKEDIIVRRKKIAILSDGELC